MATRPARAAADWLALREPADASARSPALVSRLRAAVSRDGVTVVHDLGSGTGSMARWLSARLPGYQHWVLHDRDPELLDLVATQPPLRAWDGARVSYETRLDDVSRLRHADLADAALVTASALLDMMTAVEVAGLCEGCATTRRPVLLSLSVTGQVELAPAEPLDSRVQAAFNAHQRRDRGAGPLLGPDAVTAAIHALARRGFDVETAPSPWRLGSAHSALASAWFEGWVAAACEQDPDLGAAVPSYAERRLAQAAAGRLAVTVHHLDLLALPR